jgi:hypothetical protein
MTGFLNAAYEFRSTVRFDSLDHCVTTTELIQLMQV